VSHHRDAFRYEQGASTARRMKRNANKTQDNPPAVDTLPADPQQPSPLRPIDAQHTALTPRKVRQRRIAEGVLSGKTYREIGEELNPDAKYPSQTISNRLNDKGVQEAIREQVEKTDYDKSDIRRIISLVLQSAESNAREGKLTSSQAKVLEIASRTEAMLTDKQEVNQSFVPIEGVKDMSTDQLVQELTQRLRADMTGVRP
jgi:hypothetical protein